MQLFDTALKTAPTECNEKEILHQSFLLLHVTSLYTKPPHGPSVVSSIKAHVLTWREVSLYLVKDDKMVTFNQLSGSRVMSKTTV